MLSCINDGTPGKRPPAPSVSERGGRTLILRKTEAQSLIEGWNPKIWSEDDYCILDGEQIVGRIYPEVVLGQPKWKWFLRARPATAPYEGLADTLAGAKAAFKKRCLEGKDTRRSA